LIRFSIPQLLNIHDEHIKTSCAIKIPMYIPPSYNFKKTNSRSSVYVNVHYDIKLEVKIKGLFSDFELQVPIIIGTDSAEHSSNDDMTKTLTIPMDLNMIDMIESDVHDDDIALLGRINDRTTFEPGQYTHPFSIRLPDNLPPTIHPLDYPFVRYELQLLIEKKWYCSNIHSRYPLRIYPRVNLLQMSNTQCAVKFDTKRKDLTIKGIVQRSGLIPGEQTILSLEIYNPNHLTIKHIDICLIQRYEIEQCRRR
ncbi:unnamed protein product, partial [Rotaria sordida]